MDSLSLQNKQINSQKLLKDLKIKPEYYWIRKGEKMALKLFQEMSQRVPAYKDFLKKNKFNPTQVKAIADFKNIPFIDKNNYLRSYPLEKLSWDGQFDKKRWIFSTTSGSTGEPYYFPRQETQDLQYALTAELYLLTNFQIDKKSTLYIDGFAMGAWIGGLFTYQAIRIIAERGKYPLSIITPGSSKEEIIKAVKNIGQKFDQIIIGGYPPFVKDTIDYGIIKGLDWTKYNMKFVFSAEGFSESFRDYIIEKTNLKNPLLDTINHYGTVDLGTQAHETPLSILVRRVARNDQKLNQDIFNNPYSQATFAQYIPEMFFHENISGKLICSANSGIPLVRYDLKDQGGIITFKDLEKIFQKNGQNLTQEIKTAKISQTVWNLPFVYVKERADFIVKLCGANIYPETIKKALANNIYFSKISGKFVMIIKFDKKQDQYLEINIELNLNIQPKSEHEKHLTKTIVEHLLKENSEYQYLYTHIQRKQVIPKIKLWNYGHPTYFAAGGKQKWVKNPRIH